MVYVTHGEAETRRHRWGRARPAGLCSSGNVSQFDAAARCTGYGYDRCWPSFWEHGQSVLHRGWTGASAHVRTLGIVSHAERDLRYRNPHHDGTCRCGHAFSAAQQPCVWRVASADVRDRRNWRIGKRRVGGWLLSGVLLVLLLLLDTVRYLRRSTAAESSR